MANIIGIDHMSAEQIRAEVAKGGKFVQYIWCISILVMTFKRSSDIYFIPAGESAVKKGLSYTFLTLFVGWWGIPWGPIYSLQCLGKNLSGGYDHTEQLMAHIGGSEELATADEQQSETKEIVAPVAMASDDAATLASIRPSVEQKPIASRNHGGPVIRR